MCNGWRFAFPGRPGGDCPMTTGSLTGIKGTTDRRAETTPVTCYFRGGLRKLLYQWRGERMIGM